MHYSNYLLTGKLFLKRHIRLQLFCRSNRWNARTRHWIAFLKLLHAIIIKPVQKCSRYHISKGFDVSSQIFTTLSLVTGCKLILLGNFNVRVKRGAIYWQVLVTKEWGKLTTTKSISSKRNYHLVMTSTDVPERQTQDVAISRIHTPTPIRFHRHLTEGLQEHPPHLHLYWWQCLTNWPLPVAAWLKTDMASKKIMLQEN